MYYLGPKTANVFTSRGDALFGSETMSIEINWFSPIQIDCSNKAFTLSEVSVHIFSDDDTTIMVICEYFKTCVCVCAIVHAVTYIKNGARS